MPFANHMGAARAIATVSTEKKAALARAAGADDIVERGVALGNVVIGLG